MLSNIDPAEITHHRTLLDTHRRNLQKLREQRAKYGIAIPIDLMNSIEQEQAAIQDEEAALRAVGEPTQERLYQPSNTVRNNSAPAQSESNTDTSSPSSTLSESTSLENSRIASAGFDALRELTGRPEVREALNALRADLHAAQRQITLMTAYKNLHDHFQKLESCYNTIHYFIYRNNQLVATDQLPWESLAQSEPDLGELIVALLDCATGPELAAEHGAWQQQLERAHSDLQVSIATSDSILLKRATKAIRDVCNNQPSRINDRMFGAVRTLRELSPGEKFQILRDRLLELNLDPVERRLAMRFDEGINALGRLSQQLDHAIDSHNDFQEVDNQLRLIETTIEQDISGLLYAWEDLRQYSHRLCERNREKWSVQFTAINVELEHTLEQSIASDIIRCFRKYRSQAGRCFDKVDASLLRLCNDLTTFGGSLAPLLEVL